MGKRRKNLLYFNKWRRDYISSRCKTVSSFEECYVWFCFRVKFHMERKEKQIQTDVSSWNKTKITEIKYIPLCMYRIETKLWIGLPEKFGYVEYLNEEKKILHIVTQDSRQAFQVFKEKWGTILKGNFVSFREYTTIKSMKRKLLLLI